MKFIEFNNWSIILGYKKVDILPYIFLSNVGVDGVCRYDWVSVKQTWNNLTALEKHCGRESPPMVNTRGTTLLTFITDYSMQLKGFSARYKVSHQMHSKR